MDQPHAPPLPYRSDIERRELSEDHLAHALRWMMRDIQRTTLRHYGHSTRGIHSKSHGLIEGQLEVLGNLPPELAQGLFAKPRGYPVVMRLSINRGDIIDDDISVPRGLALKVVGIEGERLRGSEGNVTQDFLFVNQPAFTEPNLKVFVRNIAFVDATTDTGLAWKKVFGAALRPVVAGIRGLGGRAWTLTTMGGHPLTHPLGDIYYSQVPFRYGDFVAKFSLAPVSPELGALRDRQVDLRGKPNGLREALIDFFRVTGGVWELRAQLRTDARAMPIEDASVVWPAEKSPYRTVARLTVPPQPAWSEERARQVDDGLTFNPWNGLKAHQPLGAINRVRREAYPESAAFRARHNGCPIREPRCRPDLSDVPPQVYGSAPGREGRRPGTPDAPWGAWAPPMRPVAKALKVIAILAAAGFVVSRAMQANETHRTRRSADVARRRPPQRRT